VLLSELGRPAEAEAQLLAAIDAGNLMARVSLADLYTDLGRLEDAEEQYQAAIAEGVLEAHVSYGNLLAGELYRPQQAEAHYREALAVGVQLAFAHFDLGILLANHGRIAAAANQYRAALSYGESQAHVNLAEVLVVQNPRGSAGGTMHLSWEVKASVASATDITHIVSTPDVRGGKPRIRGHRIAVHDIAIRTGEGMRPEDIAAMYGLTLGEVHAALSYYYDHRDQIDREIEEEDEEIRRLGQADGSPVAERVRQARRGRGGG
jgi:uncharacterized protein (DUF433 family)